MRALKGLACRKRGAAASSPAATTCKQGLVLTWCSRFLRDTLAAAPGLLAHACVTEIVDTKHRYTAIETDKKQNMCGSYICVKYTRKSMTRRTTKVKRPKSRLSHPPFQSTPGMPCAQTSLSQQHPESE